MESEKSDSKKIYKVFDASKRIRSRKRKDGVEDANSLASEESKSIHRGNSRCIMSAKSSLQDLKRANDLSPNGLTPKRENSSQSVKVSPARTFNRECSSSPRRHRRIHRDDVSLALNAGLISSPRSISPDAEQTGDGLEGNIPVDQDSFVYAFLEEAIRKDKRRHRRHRGETQIICRDHHDDHRVRDKERDRRRDRRERDEDDTSPSREQRRRHGRRHDEPSRDHEADKPVKDNSQLPFDQNALFETFAKLCSTITENTNQNRPTAVELIRNHSHKSLQCEVVSKPDPDLDQRPERLRSRPPSRDTLHRSNTRVRSVEDLPPRLGDSTDKYTYEMPVPQYTSKMEVAASRVKLAEEARFRERERPAAVPARSCVDHACARDAADRRDGRDYLDRRDPFTERRFDGDRRRREHTVDPRVYREFDERRDLGFRERRFDDDRRRFDEDRRRCCEKTSRSFDPQRESYPEDLRRTARSDCRKKRYDDGRDRYADRDRRYDPRDKYYEDRDREYRSRHCGNIPSKDRHYRRADRADRCSVTSHDEDFVRERDREFWRERDGCSERERDSAPSVADGDTSTVSGKSNYIKVVKGIAEQREAMDKMMKLWKELMRCFKGISQNPNQDKAAQESVASIQESAAAQLRLWRECMRRYETVARDVGDTDARLMDEIAKQRSEMAEMANMWHECLQRYKDISNDFNTLKKQLESEGTSRIVPPPCAPVAPPLDADGKTAAPYHLPPSYLPPPMPMAMPGGGYGGSPLRERQSAPPPAWWWMGEPPPAARRRSSPDSRRSNSRDRDRDRRRDHSHRRKDHAREDSRYKQKSSVKPDRARSDHRHRKR